MVLWRQNFYKQKFSLVSKNSTFCTSYPQVISYPFVEITLFFSSPVLFFKKGGVT